MKADNLRKVATAIRTHAVSDLGFNMRDWVSNGETDMSGHRCKTTACIAGWTVAVLKEKSVHELVYSEKDIIQDAKYLLDLYGHEQSGLFIDRPSYVISMGDVTPEMAACVLEYAADHDKIDWDAACVHLNPARGAV